MMASRLCPSRLRSFVYAKSGSEVNALERVPLAQPATGKLIDER
ncbi:MAG TPA: hypothetical protein VGO69_10500 [Pyrinomonadaceae bacterium]|nr:hypothetical protein [Pyrinomonadaceae bacterium]